MPRYHSSNPVSHVESVEERKSSPGFREKPSPDYVALGPAFVASVTTKQSSNDEESLACWQTAATILVKVAYRVASSETAHIVSSRGGSTCDSKAHLTNIVSE